jgi:hypothetical protein
MTRKWIVALAAIAGAAVTTAATGAAYVLSHDGNQPLPVGEHTVQIYTVDESISTVVPPDERPGVVGRFIGMCDGDTYYLEVGGVGQCVVLSGPYGKVRATGTKDGVQLSAADAAHLRDVVRGEDDGSDQPVERVVLGYDGGWAGMVQVADLRSGEPVTGAVID